MNNVLIDDLPHSWENENGKAYEIETDYKIGIQMCLAQDDPDLSEEERAEILIGLLFVDEIPDSAAEIGNCISFFLSGWNHDNKSRKKEKERLMDFDVDQWRIYSGFLQQYRIDLNTIDYMHFWTFMGMLSCLQECSYTRVIDIRRKKFRPKMDKEERESLQEAKQIYSLERRLSAEEQEAEDSLYDFLGGNLKYSKREQERIAKFEKYADE